MKARAVPRSGSSSPPQDLEGSRRLEEKNGGSCVSASAMQQQQQQQQQQHPPSRIHPHPLKDKAAPSARARKRRRHTAAAATLCASPSCSIGLFATALFLSGRCLYYGSYRITPPSSLLSTPSTPVFRKGGGLKYAHAAALQRRTDDELWKMGDVLLSHGEEEDEQTLTDPPPNMASRPAADRKHHYSSGRYRDVLWIRQTDQLGGAGTALLQLVIGQLLYAHQHKLAPWIHLDNSSLVVYDPVVHRRRAAAVRPVATTKGTERVRVITNVTWIRRPAQYRHYREAVPGPPAFEGEIDEYQSTLEELVASTGTDGIWEHYFEPVDPHRRGCMNNISASSTSAASSAHLLPHVTLPLYLITPGLHGYSSTLATQAWRYEYLPSYVTQPHLPLHRWLEPRRIRAHGAIQQYIRFRPHLQELAHRVNPNCRFDAKSSCLGLHIRHSDKAAGRRIVPVGEFLPYVEEFVRNGGQFVYVATDSTLVWDEIQRDWPESIKGRLRALHISATTAATSKNLPTRKIHRSSDQRAVFDLEDGASDSSNNNRPRHLHHDTNQQALVEILALSNCQFMVHGLSAMSEAAIWINLELHNASVNLEADSDEDEQVRWTPKMFGNLVRKALADEPPASWPNPVKQLRDWWNDENAQDITARDGETPLVGKPPRHSTATLDDPCRRYEGVLLIRSVRKGATTAGAFFIDVANQLLYAEQHRLLPIVHLDPNEVELIFDSSRPHRNQSSLVARFVFGHDREAMDAPLERSTNDETQAKDNVRLIPGQPRVLPGVQWNASTFPVTGSGIWDDYFEPLHEVEYLSRFESCKALPAMTLSAIQVSSLALYAPWALRAWRYDGVPAELWDDAPSPGLDLDVVDRSQSKKAAMRLKGHELAGRYLHFRPYLLRQAQHVNPAPTNDNDTSCLAVHIRVGPKPGKHRSLVKADTYLPYLEAFVRGGGNRIYVATDSHRALQYIHTTVPEHVKSRIRSAGRYVVRSRMSSPHPDSLPTHLLENHNRVNAETLVDILALSKCDMLLHSSSSVAEAAVYLNERLAHHPERTVNLELPQHQRVSPAEFEALTRRLLQTAGR